MLGTDTIAPGFDIAKIREQFPVLSRTVKGRPLVYFDNAATSQKPAVVIDALMNYYRQYNANIHRGIHTLAEEATVAYEATRDAVQAFIQAGNREEIIFTRGTTESINLVAYTWGRQNIQAGDEIIISAMEHHSNIVPWQILCEEKKAVLKIIPISEEGELQLSAYYDMLNNRTKLVSIVQASNALGTINPVKEMISAAHAVGAVVLVDGAQSSVHLDINVVAMDCDFFAFSLHKLYGPTGVGILYGKKELLEAMPPFQGGGEMIKEVQWAKTTYAALPYKFEAGTPNIADVVAAKTALEFLKNTGPENAHAHEQELLAYATQELRAIKGVRLIGQARHKVSLVSFIIDNTHPQDLGILLDNAGIAVRTGHHCTQPLMHQLGIPGTVRASFALYNTKEEINVFITALQKAIKMLV